MSASASSDGLAQALKLHLSLGRTSNLPTVWSNVLAATVVSGGIVTIASTIPLLLACSMMYVGGMYLNDACDANIDARERPERPIPSGQISRQRVFGYSAGWLLSGLLLFVLTRLITAGIHGALLSPTWLLAPLALLASIVAYNFYHKGNPLGPVLMAACRALVYLSVGITLASTLSGSLMLGASLAFLWIMGLTALAKRESSAKDNTTQAPSLGLADWPLVVLALPMVAALLIWQLSITSVVLCLVLTTIILIARSLMRSPVASNFGRAIGLLISGVSIVDALIIASMQQPMLAVLAALCCPLTLLLQQRISGT